MNLENLIKKYSWYHKNENITSKNFPEPAHIETKEKPQIVTIDRYMTTEEVLALLKSKGLRPANIYELLSQDLESLPKGKYYVALGSEWIDGDGDRGIPCVRARSGGDFYFSLGSLGGGWDDDDAFFGLCDKTLGTLNTQSKLSPSDTLTLPETLVINGVTYKKQ